MDSDVALKAHVLALLLPVLLSLRDRWAQIPREAISHVVREGLVGRGRHVAGRAGWRDPIVHANYPVGRIEVHLVDIRVVDVAML